MRNNQSIRPPFLRYIADHFPVTRKVLIDFKKTTWQILSFVILLWLYLVGKVVYWFYQKHLIPAFILKRCQYPITSFYSQSVTVLNLQRKNSINRLDLIELSLRNMRVKKTRTYITIGGMAIGIATIVFLVSIGYGLQQLVISRVARLDEMKQADITPQVGSKLKINDRTMADLKKITDISMVLPLISVVGRVSYQNSETDMAVYGVTADYLRQSAIKPIYGTLFASNDVVNKVSAIPQEEGQVAGASTKALPSQFTQGDTLGSVEFSINPLEWVRVRETASVNGKVLGYTKRTEGNNQGEETIGSAYEGVKSGTIGPDSKGNQAGIWLKAKVLLWEKKSCDKTKGDCEEGSYIVMRNTDGTQTQKEGYFAQLNVAIKGGIDTYQTDKNVLGASTDQSTKSGTLDFVNIASEGGIISPPTVKTVAVTTGGEKQAIVNRAMLKVLGIKETEALGKTFSTSFIVVGDLLDTPEQLQSAATTYKIIGITPDSRTPIFYIPFMDLRSLGISNYSQIKVVSQDQAALPKIRRQIEAMGYITHSVADTVSQINSLFSTARVLLTLLGMVALGVAALGMFNTLTVSLLERTREVGLMKAMGMKSSEVQELFLTESMMMGFFGGVFGIILGYAVGKVLSIGLSIFSIVRGAGFIDITYLPLSFIFVIIVLSLLVGLFTGIYPARRATKISALDALRYE